MKRFLIETCNIKTLKAIGTSIAMAILGSEALCMQSANHEDGIQKRTKMYPNIDKKELKKKLRRLKFTDGRYMRHRGGRHFASDKQLLLKMTADRKLTNFHVRKALIQIAKSAPLVNISK